MNDKASLGRWSIFRFRPYLLYFIGHTISMLGTGMQFIATSWLAMELTGNSGAVAYVLIATSLPGILLSPLIGVYIDRFDRKWIAVLMDVFRAAVLVGIPVLWWQGLLEPWHLYTASFLVSLGDEVYTPAAMSLIREVLPPKALLYANSTNTIAMQAGALVGAALGGVIISLSSSVTVMLINAGSFLISGIFIVRIRKGLVIPSKAGSTIKAGVKTYWSEIRAGLAYIQGRHRLVIFYAMIFFIRMSLYTINVLLAPFAKDVLEVGSIGFGYIDACFAIGAVAGNLILPQITQAKGTNFVMVLGMSGTALAIMLFGFSVNLGMGMFIYFILGMFFQVGVLYLTRAQEETELSYQGRVHSTFNTLFSILSLGIYLGMAFLMQHYSFRLIYVVQGVVVAIAAITAFRVLYSKPKGVQNNVSG
ncbi:MFS transporter [Paenibacillus sp. S150]|uniref:MFS transporter n=1 Tax=Paenibacillus sp. S150 TaxID=2749826 RepID=UPI001C5714A7|nr:MFS transporter [Paenibacillus sp. S150]MBW4082416.1 MFS transporter [Paenibacillus sp. S150]